MFIGELKNRIGSKIRLLASRWLGRRPIFLQSAKPIISFTFDDFPTSALKIGGAILKNHRIAGTYYASLGLMDRDSPVGRIFSADDLKNLIAQGDELGCHTFAHCHAWATKPRTFEESITQNRWALEQLMPGILMQTLSYPISFPRPQTKKAAAKYFFCSRGGGQIFNRGLTDLNNLSAFFLEKNRETPDLIKTMINRNCEACGWLIFATHDVCDKPSRFGCTPQFFEDIVRFAVNSNSQILPVSKALGCFFPSRRKEKL